VTERFFIDRAGVLTNKRKTATGGYLVDAVLASVGVMRYAQHEPVPGAHFNPPEVLQAHLDVLTTCPVTHRHPKRMVSTETYKEVARGHVVGTPAFADGKLTATLAIHDADLIREIEAGRAREVSMGYLAALREQGGEYEGQTYDHVRTDIQWNHIAIVPEGRAGKDVCLVLDSAEIPGEDDMKFKVNGKEYEAEKVQGAIDALEMLLENAKGEAKELKVQLDAKAEELKVAKSAETIDAAVDARLVAKKADEERASRRAAVVKAYPNMKLEGKTAETIDALFESIDAKAEEQKSLAAVAPGAAGASTGVKDAKPASKPSPDASRQSMIQGVRTSKAPDGE
jgi:hypothetical protein